MLKSEQLIQADLTFVFPNIHYSSSWDISNASSLWTFFILDNIVEPIIRVDEKTGYQSSIAKEWYFSKDKKELVFLLREDYLFHDGKKISTTDVYNSIMRVLKLKVTAHSDLQSALCDSGSCEKNIKLDGKHLRIKLNKPLNGILFNFATPEYGVVPKSYSEKTNVNKEDLSVLSGPYQVVHFDERKMRLKAFKKHKMYSENMPQIVDIVQITEVQKAIEFYQSNKNVVLVGSEYSSSSKYIDLEGNKITSAMALTEFIVPNRRSAKVSKKSFLGYFTQALEEIKPNIGLDPRVSELTTQLFTKSSMARLAEPKNTAEKNKISPLEKAEFYKMIVFDWMKDSKVPHEIAKHLKKYNINLNIEIVSSRNTRQIVNNRDYDFLYIYSGVSAPDPIIELIYLENQPIDDLKYKNQYFSELLEETKVEADREKYLVKLKKLHSHMLSNYRIIPVFHTPMVYLTNSPYSVENLNHFDGELNIWKWKK